MKHNQRQHARTVVQESILLSCTMDGMNRLFRGKCVEVSEAGMKVVCPERIPVRTFLNLRCDSLGLHGSGSVRYSMSWKMQYRIGIEFTGATAWKKDGTPLPQER